MREERDRIIKIYKDRERNYKDQLYAWHQPDVRQQQAIFVKAMACALKNTLGYDLSHCKILDVGCGNGRFLRLLIDWGADPKNLTGTEYRSDILLMARNRTANGIQWHLGELTEINNNERFHLVSAHTVFSSILNEEIRAYMAKAMWEKVKPGGYVQIFDFRFNNPKNPHVRKVLKKELDVYWNSNKIYYKTLLLPPIIVRKLPEKTFLFAEMLHTFIPFIKTHFIYMARKKNALEVNCEKVEVRKWLSSFTKNR